MNKQNKKTKNKKPIEPAQVQREIHMALSSMFTPPQGNIDYKSKQANDDTYTRGD